MPDTTVAQPLPAAEPAPMLPMSADAIRVLVEEMRKPYVDREAEARKAAARARLQQDEKERMEALAVMQEACAHVREDSSSAVAWYPFQNTRGTVTIGVCQRCNLTLRPSHPKYLDMLKVPTRTGVMNGLMG